MGLDFTTILLSYLVMVCTLLTLATILLYPITCLLGGVSLRQFAAGVLPAQSVALSTRSSLASLPALLEGSKDILKLNPAVANLTLPLAVSVFKTNRTISSTFSLLVLGHIFGLDLGPIEITTFVITSMILSFSSVGIPMGGNSMLALPAYLAAGVPLEGYLLLKTVNPISDVPKTLVNVTGDMSVATVLNRYFGR
jgi:Na+/H+-dicarboxylate symporter